MAIEMPLNPAPMMATRRGLLSCDAAGELSAVEAVPGLAPCMRSSMGIVGSRSRLRGGLNPVTLAVWIATDGAHDRGTTPQGLRCTFSGSPGLIPGASGH